MLKELANASVTSEEGGPILRQLKVGGTSQEMRLFIKNTGLC